MTFDFLGSGRSDRSDASTLDVPDRQQELEAVVHALGLDSITLIEPPGPAISSLSSAFADEHLTPLADAMVADPWPTAVAAPVHRGAVRQQAARPQRDRGNVATGQLASLDLPFSLPFGERDQCLSPDLPATSPASHHERGYVPSNARRTGPNGMNPT